MAAGPNHFSDYGFDPQIDFFQGLEQASMRRNSRHKMNINGTARWVDSTSSFHFKLQKPISKDHVKKKQKQQQQHHSKWWRTAFLFFQNGCRDFTGCCPSAAAAAGVNSHALIFIGSTSSDTLIGSTSRPPPPPPAEEEEEEEEGTPYVSLRELNMEEWRNSTSAMPLYLVT